MTATYRAGELYMFTNTQTGNRIWGIFSRTDDKGRIVLETATADFDTFRRHIILPPSYHEAKIASRSELRDFAYNMGFRRI